MIRAVALAWNASCPAHPVHSLVQPAVVVNQMVPYKIVRADNGDAWVEVRDACTCSVRSQNCELYTCLGGAQMAGLKKACRTYKPGFSCRAKPPVGTVVDEGQASLLKCWQMLVGWVHLHTWHTSAFVLWRWRVQVVCTSS